MKKKLYLHVGAGKTGSSMMQTAFARNIDMLQEAGIHYPEARKHALAVQGKPTNGNSTNLHSMLAPRKCSSGYNTDITQKFLAALMDAPGDKILISGESLNLPKPEHLVEFMKITDKLGIEVEVIFYVRNALEFAFSSWLQRVNTSGRPIQWSSFINSFRLSYGRTAKAYSKAFPGRLRVINYDSHRENLLKPIGDIIGFEFTSKEAQTRVNRSLTKIEAEVFYYIGLKLEGYDLQPGQIRPILTTIFRNLPSVPMGRRLRPIITEDDLEAFERNNRIDFDAVNKHIPDNPIQLYPEHIEIGALVLEPLPEELVHFIEPMTHGLAFLYQEGFRRNQSHLKQKLK